MEAKTTSSFPVDIPTPSVVGNGGDIPSGLYELNSIGFTEEQRKIVWKADSSYLPKISTGS